MPVWSISCFYVRKGYRKQGITSALIGAALRRAKAAGAPALEAYPLDGELTPSTSGTGYASTFCRLGFQIVGRHTPARPIMRRDLRMVCYFDGVSSIGQHANEVAPPVGAPACHISERCEPDYETSCRAVVTAAPFVMGFRQDRNRGRKTNAGADSSANHSPLIPSLPRRRISRMDLRGTNS